MARQTGRHDTFKANRLDYDFIMGYSDSGDFPICLSWRERQALLSIIDSLAWPTRWDSEGTVDTDAIEQLRNQIAYKLMGECPVDCADVIQCLIDDMDEEGDIYAALVELLINQLRDNPDATEIIGGIGDGATTLALASVNLTSGACDDLDDTFGFAMQIVEFIHMLVLDFYEILETTTNWAEAMAAALDSVPLLTEVTDFIDFIQNNLYETYIANWDLALKQEYACELWCYMQRTDCTLSWQDLVDYYRKKGHEDYTGTTIADFLNWAILGTFTGDLAVSVSHLTLCYVLLKGGSWAGISLQDIQRIILSFFNDPDEDWSILCDTCAPWIATFDFTDSDGGFSKEECGGSAAGGTYVVDTGWQHEDIIVDEDPDTYRRNVSIGLDTEVFNLFYMEMTFDFTKGTYYKSSDCQRLYTENDVRAGVLFSASENGDDQVLSVEHEQGWDDIDNIGFFVRSSHNTDPVYSGAVLVTKLVIKGYGDIPAEITANATSVEYL